MYVCMYVIRYMNYFNVKPAQSLYQLFRPHLFLAGMEEALIRKPTLVASLTGLSSHLPPISSHYEGASKSLDKTTKPHIMVATATCEEIFHNSLLSVHRASASACSGLFVATSLALAFLK